MDAENGKIYVMQRITEERYGYATGIATLAFRPTDTEDLIRPLAESIEEIWQGGQLHRDHANLTYGPKVANSLYFGEFPDFKGHMEVGVGTAMAEEGEDRLYGVTVACMFQLRSLDADKLFNNKRDFATDKALAAVIQYADAVSNVGSRDLEQAGQFAEAYFSRHLAGKTAGQRMVPGPVSVGMDKFVGVHLNGYNGSKL